MKSKNVLQKQTSAQSYEIIDPSQHDLPELEEDAIMNDYSYWIDWAGKTREYLLKSIRGQSPPDKSEEEQPDQEVLAIQSNSLSTEEFNEHYNREVLSLIFEGIK